MNTNERIIDIEGRLQIIEAVINEQTIAHGIKASIKKSEAEIRKDFTNRFGAHRKALRDDIKAITAQVEKLKKPKREAPKVTVNTYSKTTTDLRSSILALSIRLDQVEKRTRAPWWRRIFRKGERWIARELIRRHPRLEAHIETRKAGE